MDLCVRLNRASVYEQATLQKVTTLPMDMRLLLETDKKYEAHPTRTDNLQESSISSREPSKLTGI